MSYLLEILGRGLVSSLRGALRTKLPPVDDVSVPVLRQRLAEDPQQEQKALMLGLKLLWDDQFLKAAPIFEEILTRNEESVPALLGLASVHDEMGRTEEALDLLNQARMIDVLDPVILFCIGFCCEKLHQLDPAVEAYRASLRACPDLRNTHERLAAIFLKQDRHALALSHYEQLVDIEPERMADRITLANLYLKVGDAEAAVRHYERALTLDPDNWEVQEDLVTAYDQAGLVRESIELLERMIRRQPDSADNHLRLGDLYAKAGEDKAARSEYERALQMHPEYLEVMVKLGTNLLRAGEHAPAAKWFNRAVEINDRLLTACVGLGVAQLQAGRHQEGLGSFELASKIEPNSALLFSETARMQLKASVGEQVERYLGVAPVLTGGNGRSNLLLDQQIERHQQAILEKPNHADLHYRLGLLLRNRGRLHDAIQAFRQAVDINPVYEKALIKLGLSLREAGRIDEAVALFKRALEVRPDDVESHYQLGLLFAEKHLFDLAVGHFEEAQHGMPGSVDVQANLALALQNAGLLDRAEISWRTTLDLGSQRASPGAKLN